MQFGTLRLETNTTTHHYVFTRTGHDWMYETCLLEVLPNIWACWHKSGSTSLWCSIFFSDMLCDKLGTSTAKCPANTQTRGISWYLGTLPDFARPWSLLFIEVDGVLSRSHGWPKATLRSKLQTPRHVTLQHWATTHRRRHRLHRILAQMTPGHTGSTGSQVQLQVLVVSFTITMILRMFQDLPCHGVFFIFFWSTINDSVWLSSTAVFRLPDKQWLDRPPIVSCKFRTGSPCSLCELKEFHQNPQVYFPDACLWISAATRWIWAEMRPVSNPQLN